MAFGASCDCFPTRCLVLVRPSCSNQYIMMLELGAAGLSSEEARVGQMGCDTINLPYLFLTLGSVYGPMTTADQSRSVSCAIGTFKVKRAMAIILRWYLQ